MVCEKCGGQVIWKGPFSNLTHTECQNCGGINCQVIEPEDDDEPATEELGHTTLDPMENIN